MWKPETRCPMQAALALRNALDIHTFIETGTAQGDTSFIASGHFTNVITMEIHEPAYEVAKRHLQYSKNIISILDDSVAALPSVLQKLGGPAFFWLDAHYSGGPTKISDTECPVLREISMIRNANPKHVIFIDDMQIFVTAGKAREEKMQGWSNKWDDWPFVDAIEEELHRHGPYFVCLREHVMCGVPPECEKVLLENL